MTDLDHTKFLHMQMLEHVIFDKITIYDFSKKNSTEIMYLFTLSLLVGSIIKEYLLNKTNINR